ncbi:MAG TPA: hypothetical protein VNA20_17925 [Frankiaceae bacterium]|nr:hypothetical protein [Frankiaceae bacterium]
MRSFHRAVATAVAGLAFTAAGIAGAGSALATPEDGKGCVGTPAVPASYVCVISLTPENALPTTASTNVPVTVPPLCYLLDCTDETVVNVPVPGVTPTSGVVAVLWYQGQYIPISAGTGWATERVTETVDLAVATALGTVATVQGVLDGLPTADVLELVTEKIGFTVDASERVVACSLQLSCDTTIEWLHG